MKRTISKLLILAMIVSLFAGFQVSAADVTTVETDYFSIDVDESVWTYTADEDLFEYSDEALMYLYIKDGDDEVVTLRIDVNVDIPWDFSEDLYYDEFDPQEFYNGGYDRVTIGGVDCVEYTSGSSVNYYGYVPDNNLYVDIYYYGEKVLNYSDEIQAAIDSIVITGEAYSGDPTPWYWDGEPYSVDETRNVKAGEYTLTDTFIPMDECLVTHNIFDSRAAYFNDGENEAVCVLHDGIISVYTKQENSLVYVGDLELDYEPSEIFMNNTTGDLVISDFCDDCTLIDYEEGDQTMISDDTDYVIMHPSGEWGISYFSVSDVAKLDMSDGSLTPIDLESTMQYISSLYVTENYIIVYGEKVDSDDYAITVFDLDFNEIFTLTEEDTTTDFLGSLSAAAETSNGLMLFDGNMRDIYLTDFEGNVLSAVDMDDLFDSDYPWLCGAQTLPDGSVMVVLTDERADESADETVVHIISGF